MSGTKAMYLLTGDIGGTNSRMALYDACNNDADDSKPRMLVEKYYRNEEHIPKDCHGQSEIFLTNILIPFLKYCWEENEDSKDTLQKPLHKVQIIATLAVAGVVSDNAVSVTNLGSLVIDGTAIAKNTQDKYLKCIVICRIINDFVAVSG
jgi:glucokinase